MALEAGSSLGPYEILAPLGAGGMGEVYKARDTRLGRDVAIKVLPSHLSEEPDLRERLEREARAVSSLNHPHICTLYDIGREDGLDFLVMELLEGETLAERLKKGALPVAEALAYAIQIADALDKAHRQGIVHRDLKPGNIMLTGSGAKLLDFGLARMGGPAGGDGQGLSALPTQERALTQEGAILGTFQYMAPEQLEGKEADLASDLFAFGAVLYEMVTGKKAFEGKSQASLITAIMSSDPPRLSRLQAASPPALDELVRGCLAKRPDERRHSAHDVKLELERIRDGKTETPTSATTASSKRGVALGALLGSTVGALGFGLWALTRPPERPPVVRRAVIDLAEDQILTSIGRPALALSPDGSRLAYTANQLLYLRRMDSPDAIPLPRTEGAVGPFFSPDGQWIGFWADGELKKVGLGGGVPVTLCAMPNPRGASWPTEELVLFASPEGILSVDAAGGEPEVLIPTADGEWLGHPRLLPHGEAILLFTFLEQVNPQPTVVVQSLETGARTSIVEGSHASYLPTGHLVYSFEDSLVAAPFDIDRLRTTGGSTAVVEGIEAAANTLGAHLAHSSSGDLVYLLDRTRAPSDTLVWVSRAGATTPISDTKGIYRVPRLSPDGRRLATAVRTAEDFRDIWILDIERDTLSRFTFDSAWDTQPLWSPDGSRLAFVSAREGGRRIFTKAADGSGEVTPVMSENLGGSLSTVSEDGTLFVTHISTADRGFDIAVVTADGTEAQITPFLSTPFNESQASLSPDGRFLAYTSDETGRPQVYVQSFPGGGTKHQISADGGSASLWSHAGDEIFYRSEDAMMAVAVTTEPSFSVGRPTKLFSGSFRKETGQGDTREYDVTRDGTRFVMVQQSGDSAAPQRVRLQLVTNWFEELKRLVAVQ